LGGDKIECAPLGPNPEEVHAFLGKWEELSGQVEKRQENDRQLSLYRAKRGKCQLKKNCAKKCRSLFFPEGGQNRKIFSRSPKKEIGFAKRLRTPLVRRVFEE